MVHYTVTTLLGTISACSFQPFCFTTPVKNFAPLSLAESAPYLPTEQRFDSLRLCEMQASQLHMFSLSNSKHEYYTCKSIFRKSMNCVPSSRRICFCLKFFSPKKRKTEINKPYRLRSSPAQKFVTPRLRQDKVYKSVVCSAFDVGNTINLSVDNSLRKEDSESWSRSLQHVVKLGLSIEEAEKILSKAFGYTNSIYWGQEKAKVVPDPEVVLAILDYLRGLAFSNADLLSLLKKFPELLGCSLENDLKSNVGILERTWGASGSMLKNLILRKPHVLGYNIDCKGDCMAECTRCWARF
ncbi:hypothetical protein O6H91_13G020700 [Diphasiastrum complanatum]|uniref:Uncharacterized protein n=1 Tax=Diphasiastrum complanatum TaxID=34168 RepID=A0ACC2BSS9_DIPCM|nr:hypothetical protein O6H91_13G020700 [Diphasiastrum complanatum]